MTQSSSNILSGSLQKAEMGRLIQSYEAATSANLLLRLAGAFVTLGVLASVLFFLFEKSEFYPVAVALVLLGMMLIPLAMLKYEECGDNHPDIILPLFFVVNVVIAYGRGPLADNDIVGLLYEIRTSSLR